MITKKEKLELDLLLTKVQLINGITNCSSHEQLDQYIYNVHKVFKETHFLNKAKKKEISNAKVMKEH